MHEFEIEDDPVEIANKIVDDFLAKIDKVHENFVYLSIKIRL